MEASDESPVGYILSGSIFYVFGLKWCYEYAKYWALHRDLNYEQKSTILTRFSSSCQMLLRRHPLEGTLKLIATALGLVSTLVGNLPSHETDSATVSPKVVHATIYLFFALSGLVDVLTFYFPIVVSDGLAKMALAQSFFIEGFLFLWCSSLETVVTYEILAAVVWTTSLAVVLELVWPEMKLLRAASTLLHGTWLAHMVRSVRIHQPNSILIQKVAVNFSWQPHQIGFIKPQKVALDFSWHFAAAFVVTLCIVAITRSCAPKLRSDNPPEIPIYDYCGASDNRV